MSESSSDISSLSPTPTPAPSTSPTLELADPSATVLQTETDNDFFTTPLPSPTETPSGDDTPNFATTSSLYLFTFLATLLLLLAISCAIVIRSLIIRRRFQRRVQEALAEGIVLPEHPAGDARGLGGLGSGHGGGFGGPGGRRRIDFGEKPKMWDSHLAPPEDVSLETKWESLMPVSVRVQHDRLTGSGQQPPVSPPPRQGFLRSASLGFVNNQNWRPRFFRARRPTQDPSSPPSGPSGFTQSSSLGGNNNIDASSSQDNSAQQQQQLTEPIIRSEVAQLQVSVLIVMPSPYRPRSWGESLIHGMKGKSRNPYASSSSGSGSGSAHGDGEEDEELPDVVLGSAEMPWKVVVPVPNANSNQIAPSHASGGGLTSNSGSGSGRRREVNEIQMETLRPRELNASFSSPVGAR